MDVKLIPFSTIKERRGDISILEDIPFTIKRIFNIYNVSLDDMRGGHGHKKCHQLLIATCGAVLIRTSGREFILDCPDEALYIPPMHIAEMVFINPESVLTVLASEKYDKDDYYYE